MNRITQEQADELYTTSVAAEYALRLSLARKSAEYWRVYNRKALQNEHDANKALEAKKADQFNREVI